MITPEGMGPYGLMVLDNIRVYPLIVNVPNGYRRKIYYYFNILCETHRLFDNHYGGD